MHSGGNGLWNPYKLHIVFNVIIISLSYSLCNMFIFAARKVHKTKNNACLYLSIHLVYRNKTSLYEVYFPAANIPK